MKYTRFERARIIGARALQISLGAPTLVDVAEETMQFRTRLTRLAAKEGFEVGWWESPSAAGLTEQDFIDRGHLNAAGARKWTAHVARWLGRGWLVRWAVALLCLQGPLPLVVAALGIADGFYSLRPRTVEDGGQT